MNKVKESIDKAKELKANGFPDSGYMKLKKAISLLQDKVKELKKRYEKQSLDYRDTLKKLSAEQHKNDKLRKENDKLKNTILCGDEFSRAELWNKYIPIGAVAKIVTKYFIDNMLMGEEELIKQVREFK